MAAFFLGMIFLEILSLFVMDIEWPEEYSVDDSLVYPVEVKNQVDQMDHKATEDKPKQDTMDRLSADDIIAIQTGAMVASNPKVRQYIQSLTIWPSNLSLNLTEPSRVDYSQAAQSIFVDQVLKGKQNGFYIECGAANGEEGSDTLFFERERKWTGLLVEPHPGAYIEMLHKHRKAHSLNACVSPGERPRVQVLRAARGYLSGLEGEVDELYRGTDFAKYDFYQGDIPVQCFPLAAILDSMDIQEVDYLSLDVEGSEIGILRTIPFELFRINVVSVEFRAQGPKYDHQERSMVRLNEIRSIFMNTGLYEEAALLIDQPELRSVNDIAFREKFATDVVFKRIDLHNATLIDEAPPRQPS